MKWKLKTSKDCATNCAGFITTFLSYSWNLYWHTSKRKQCNTCYAAEVARQTAVFCDCHSAHTMTDSVRWGCQREANDQDVCLPVVAMPSHPTSWNTELSRSQHNERPGS